MKALIVIGGLAMGYFAGQMFAVDPNYGAAAERSFFSMVGILSYLMVVRWRGHD